jgi:hypothetical protein
MPYLDSLFQALKAQTPYDKYLEFADGIDSLYVLKSCDKVQGKAMPVTIETSGEFSYDYDLKDKSPLKGIYTGNPTDWLPILMEDGFIDDLENTCLCEIVPNKGTPLIQKERNKNLTTGITINAIETFIVTDQPVPIKSCRKITPEEITDAEETIQSWLEENEDEFDEDNDEEGDQDE